MLFKKLFAYRSRAPPQRKLKSEVPGFDPQCRKKFFSEQKGPAEQNNTKAKEISKTKICSLHKVIWVVMVGIPSFQ